MKHQMIGLACFIGCVLGTPVFAADTHCAKDETVLFNCAAGKKTISVCASKALGASAGYLQYRFGPIGKTETLLPGDTQSFRQSVKLGSLMFSGGGGAYLRFSQGDYQYVVYTAIGRGWGTKEGVSVEKAGKRVANIRCKGLAQSSIGPDLGEQAGLAADEQDFDLP